MANYGKTVFGGERITGANFSAPNVWTNFDLRFYVNDTYSLVAFPGLSVSWHGTLSIRGVHIVQTAPGIPERV